MSRKMHNMLYWNAPPATRYGGYTGENAGRSGVPAGDRLGTGWG